MASSNIPHKMQTAQVIEFHKPYKVHEVEVPSDLTPNDLLIKVAVASLCHTDFIVLEGNMGTKLPCTGSHEGAGTVVAIGSKVKDYKVGDRVMSGILHHACGSCVDFLGSENYSHYCIHQKGYQGVTEQGFFAEYARIDSAQAAKLPDSVTFETAAPLACAGRTVWRGVILAGLKKGEWLAIVGSGGGLGHLGVQFAKALGLNVVGIDARDEGIELKKMLVVEEVQKVTNGEGVTATVNVSDNEKVMATSCAITKMHRTVLQIAQPNEVTIPFRELIFRDIRVRGSLLCSPEEAREMPRTINEHGITVKTNPFNGLKEIEKVVELAELGKMEREGYHYYGLGAD